MSKYFDEIEINVTEFPDTPQFNFNFRATSVIIYVEGMGVVTWSYSGNDSNIHGKLSSEQGSISFDGIDIDKIYMKTEEGKNPLVRIWAWVKQR